MDSLSILIDDSGDGGAVYASAIIDDIISGWITTDAGELVFVG